MKKSDWLQIAGKPIFIVLAAGLLLRLVLFFIFQPWAHLDELLFADAGQYHSLALQLLRHGNFIVPGSSMDTFRTPGYPVFIAFIYAITGPWAPAVLLAQIITGLASVYLVYRIGKLLFSEAAGLIAAILLCVEPDQLYYTYSLLTDNLFVFVLLVSTLSLLYFFRGGRAGYLVLASVLTGIASLVRPITSLYPAVIITLLILFAVRSGKWKWATVTGYSVLVLLCYAMTITPWMERNHTEYGYASLSSITGSNLLNYNVAYTIKRLEHRPIDQVREDLNVKVMRADSSEKMNNPFYRSKVAGKLALDYIVHHKKDYLVSHLLGMVNIYSSMEFKPFTHRFFKTETNTMTDGTFDKFSMNAGRLRTLPLVQLVTGILFALLMLAYYASAAWGAVLVFREKRYALLLALAIIILYFTLLTGVVGLARYKLPISPFYILLSGYCLDHLLQLRRHDKKALQQS